MLKTDISDRRKYLVCRGLMNVLVCKSKENERTPMRGPEGSRQWPAECRPDKGLSFEDVAVVLPVEAYIYWHRCSFTLLVLARFEKIYKYSSKLCLNLAETLIIGYTMPQK
jgi:hypothetical protein